MQSKFKEWVIPAIIGVTSFGAGSGTGYFFCKIRNSRQPEIVVEAEDPEDISDAQLELDFERSEIDRRYNQRIYELEHLIDELRSVDPLEEFRKKAAAITVVPNEVKAEHPSNGSEVVVIHQEDILVTRVFEEDEDDWDYEYELDHREPPKPYIIHRDEYDENEGDYRQCSLTYYEGDNILCDEQDVPVYNPETIVGRLIFGHGSRDPSICYVRNDKVESIFEVIIDHGTYQAEVLGEQIEHSMQRAPAKPKFRLD